MRAIFSLLIIVFLSLTFVSSAEGARYSQRGIRAQRPGPIYRLIQLERRKNAWIRRTFFNRY